ncbi:MAG: protein kinase domain-containing protein, partial [Planctomycetota bacterium]
KESEDEKEEENENEGEEENVEEKESEDEEEDEDEEEGWHGQEKVEEGGTRFPVEWAAEGPGERSVERGGGVKNLGKYKILGEIGRGAMGVVYKAVHTDLDKTVAIKTLHPAVSTTPEDLKRFQGEARAVAELKHPNIVQVHDVGEQDSIHYFAMDYVEGSPLDHLIDNKTVSPRRAMEIVCDIAKALAFVHEKGVFHRDIKPSNIFITADGKPLLGDFGLAKRVDSSEKLTQSGATMGTPAYMPPEQAGEAAHVDARADIYSLGAVLYELLTLRPPFEGATAVNVLYQVLNKDPIPPTKLVRRVHKDIETICLKCLEKDPGRRYGSAAELAEDIGRFLEGEPIVAVKPGPVSVLFRKVGRNKWWSLAVTLILLMLATISALALWARQEALKERGKWVLAFEDDFEREEVGPDWKTTRGTWQIHDGALCCSKKFESCIIHKADLSGDVRVEYEAWAEEWPVCSLSCVLNGTESWPVNTGYYLGFGDNFNVRSYIKTPRGMMTNNPEARIERGKRHKITAQRLDSRITITVDDEVVNSFEDYFPMVGDENKHVGLYSFTSHVHFDNVKVYRRKKPEKLTAMRAADILFQEKSYPAAVRYYRQTRQETEGRERDMAAFKEGLALASLGKAGEARECFETLVRDSEFELIRAYGATQIAKMIVEEEGVEAAWEYVFGKGGAGEVDEAYRYKLFSLMRHAAALRRTGRYRLAYELTKRLLEAHGGDLVPNFEMLLPVVRAMSRQGKYSEIKTLLETIEGRMNSKRAAASDLGWLTMNTFARVDPEYSSRRYEFFEKALVESDWPLMMRGVDQGKALLLARRGDREGFGKMLPAGLHLYHLFRNELDLAAREARENLAVSGKESAGGGVNEVYGAFQSDVESFRILIAAGELAGLEESLDGVFERVVAKSKWIENFMVFGQVLALYWTATGRPEKVRRVLERLLIDVPGLGSTRSEEDFPLLAFLAGKMGTGEFERKWMYGVVECVEDAPWALRFWKGVKLDTDGKVDEAARHYGEVIADETVMADYRELARRFQARLLAKK